MKKIIAFLTAAVIFLLPFSAFAQGEDGQMPEQETVNASQPRLMVVSYECDTLSPDKNSEVTVKLKNNSRNKNVYNIKLSLTEESGDIRPAEIGTEYVQEIKAGKTYEWQVQLTVAKTAASGEHKLNIAAEYEDEYYSQFSSSDVLPVTVVQSVSLDHSGFVLPKKAYNGRTVSLSVTFMNTGKSVVRNCRADIEVEGLKSPGTLFVGEISAGESAAASANLTVDEKYTGVAAGEAVIHYEDEQGNEYSETIELSTEITAPPQEEGESGEDAEKYPLWWLFLIVGAAAGAGTASAVILTVRARKSRLEDEKRL